MNLRRTLLQGIAVTTFFALAGCQPDRSGPPEASGQRGSGPGKPSSRIEDGAYRVLEHVWIPMRDGVRLSARLWLPETVSPAPAVMEMVPYRKRDLYRAADDVWGHALASRGFAFARIDVRGSGESEGLLDDEYTEAELSDAVEAIAWLAGQDWCSGAVGMRGISWGGINSLQVAAKRPPALKAIIAMGATDNRFTDDAHYHGGALGRANLQWGALFRTVMASPPDPAIAGDAWRSRWLERLEAAPAIIARWMSHQSFDAYWRRGSVTADPGAIAVPALIVSGWQDTYANRVVPLLESFGPEGVGGESQAILGAWGHTYPYFAAPEGLDWVQAEVRWWERWLLGIDPGAAEPRLRAFVPDRTAREALPEPVGGRWVAPGLPSAGGGRTVVFAANRGALAPIASRDPDHAAGGGEPIVLRGDRVVGLAATDWLDRLPVEQGADDRMSVVFETAPLEADIELLGAPAMAFSATAPGRRHIAARLCEVAPDGRSWLVTYGLSNLARTGPADRGDDGLVLPFRFMAHRFKTGSRIRLSLSQSLWPMAWPAPQAGDLSVRVNSLTLPVLPEGLPTHRLAIPETRFPAEPPLSYEAAAPDAEGRYVVETRTPTSVTEIRETGTTLVSDRHERAEMVAGDPDSCKWSISLETLWKRTDWSCRLSVDCTVTADALAFNVSEAVAASIGEERVFAKTQTNRIARTFA